MVFSAALPGRVVLAGLASRLRGEPARLRDSGVLDGVVARLRWRPGVLPRLPPVGVIAIGVDSLLPSALRYAGDSPLGRERAGLEWPLRFGGVTDGLFLGVLPRAAATAY